ncbi:FecR family protein [Rubrivivax gelatinosus]|nr:FecR domain-containing protein [Rubrivivax gelatinosus]MBK1687643.1 hypothetical protein [Rubrivivax gelatinosus]
MNASSSSRAADDAPDPREHDGQPAAARTLEEDAALWAVRRQDGLTAQEEAELQDWLAGDPERGARLGQLTALWGRLGDLPADEVSALKASSTPAPSAMQGPPPMKRSWARASRPAAGGRWLAQAALAGLTAMALGGGWLGFGYWQQQPRFVQALTTARGQQISATLPDASALQLDTATRLDVAYYRDRREARLARGQALFQVTPDAARPFHVFAGPMRITVVGTRFSVRHTQDGPSPGQVSVVVEEGHVRVARIREDTTAQRGFAAGEPDSVDLVAGQAAVADAQGRIGTVTRTSAATAAAWRRGRLVLDDTPLAAAVAEFERYGDTGIVITNPAVAALRLNGSFDLQQVGVFKRALPQALPVRLRALPDGRTEVVAAP